MSLICVKHSGDVIIWDIKTLTVKIKNELKKEHSKGKQHFYSCVWLTHWAMQNNINGRKRMQPNPIWRTTFKCQCGFVQIWVCNSAINVYLQFLPLQWSVTSLAVGEKREKENIKINAMMKRSWQWSIFFSLPRTPDVLQLLMMRRYEKKKESQGKKKAGQAALLIQQCIMDFHFPILADFIALSPSDSRVRDRSTKWRTQSRNQTSHLFIRDDLLRQMRFSLSKKIL